MKHADFTRWLVSICLVLASAAPLAQAGDWQVSQLMQLLARNKSGTATFVEKKYIRVLDLPVVSTGTLYFVAPDRLEKRTLTPKPETLILAGDTLTIERPDKKRMTFRLEDHPEAAAFIESIRGTLTGDLTALETYYTLRLTGSAERWQLTLVPKQARLRSLFEHIIISGSHADVRGIEMDQSDGDHSEMVIKRIRIER